MNAVNNSMKGCESLLQSSHTNTQLNQLLTQMTQRGVALAGNVTDRNAYAEAERGSKNLFFTLRNH